MFNGFGVALIEDYLMNRLGAVNPRLLIVLRHRVVRSGVWWRIKPLSRALIDSVILYIRRGGVIKSSSLLTQLRQAVIEALAQALSRKLTLAAYLIGLRMMRARGITVESVESIISLGIMWMNTPNWYKPGITP
ncbi:MAG: hypothetical protein AT710_04880 [Thermocladium sp. ECH_B]|nr:MAG: hypothetical protein AT710_04880 [Thermocladium sp. ECH_B]